jgi:alkylation response protein AidB-like acyl-CoA dehydrogenase
MAMSVRAIEADDESAFINTIDRWIARDVTPTVKHFDHADEWPSALVEQMAELFGTNEMQRIIIARQLIKRSSEA